MEGTIIETPEQPQVSEEIIQVPEGVEPVLDEERLEMDAEYQREIIDELVDAMDELEQAKLDIESALSEKEKSVLELTEQVTSLNDKLSSLSESLTELDTLKTNMGKITEHETIGSIVQSLLEWKEVNIPKYLEEYVAQELKAIPQFSTSPVPQTSKSQKSESLNDLVKANKYF